MRNSPRGEFGYEQFHLSRDESLGLLSGTAPWLPPADAPLDHQREETRDAPKDASPRSSITQPSRSASPGSRRPRRN